MSLVKLADVVRRRDESRILAHRFSVNGAEEDLTGWTVQLYVAGALFKSVTTGSDPAVQGLIKDQTLTPGEYFFTLRAADITPYAGMPPVPCYVRLVSPDTSPPRVYSGIEFTLTVL